MDTLPSLSDIRLVCLSAFLTILLWAWKTAAPFVLPILLPSIDG